MRTPGRGQSSASNKRSGFIVSTRGSLIHDGEKKVTLKESLLDEDSFSVMMSSDTQRDKRNTVKVKSSNKRDTLDKEHEDFKNSIQNKKLKKILQTSMRSVLKKKYSYKVTLESQVIDISEVDVK